MDFSGLATVITASGLFIAQMAGAWAIYRNSEKVEANNQKVDALAQTTQLVAGNLADKTDTVARQLAAKTEEVAAGVANKVETAAHETSGKLDTIHELTNHSRQDLEQKLDDANRKIQEQLAASNARTEQRLLEAKAEISALHQRVADLALPPRMVVEVPAPAPVQPPIAAEPVKVQIEQPEDNPVPVILPIKPR